MTINSKDFEAIGKIYEIAFKKRMYEEGDCTFLVCGKTGSGKSDFIFKSIEYCENKYNIEISAEHIGMDIKHFSKAVYLANQKPKIQRLVALDEGAELSSTNIFSRELRGTKDLFTVIRKAGFMTWIAFTNPNKITQYFREDGIKGIFILSHKKIYENNPDKSYSVVYFYHAKQWNDIRRILEMKGTINIDSILKFPPLIKATIYGRYKGHLRVEYDEKKDNHINNIIEKNYNTYWKEEDTGEKTYSMPKICKAIGFSRNSINKYVPEDFLQSRKDIAGNFKFKEEDIDYIKKTIESNIIGKKTRKLDKTQSNGLTLKAKEEFLKEILNK